MTIPALPHRSAVGAGNLKKAETREMLSKGGTTDGWWVATGKTSYVGWTAWSIIQCTSCKKRKKTFEYLRACRRKRESLINKLPFVPAIPFIAVPGRDCLLCMQGSFASPPCVTGVTDLKQGAWFLVTCLVLPDTTLFLQFCVNTLVSLASFLFPLTWQRVIECNAALTALIMQAEFNRQSLKCREKS